MSLSGKFLCGLSLCALALAVRSASSEETKAEPAVLRHVVFFKFKADVVQKNTQGVGYLFKKNKIEHIKGNGKITAPGKVEVDGQVKTMRVSVKAIRSGLVKRPAKKKPFTMPQL